MGKIKSGQAILVGLFMAAVSIVAFDIFSPLSADVLGGWADHQPHGRFYHVVGPFQSMPYIGASLMLPLILVKRLPEARRALAGVFGVFIVGGALWWAFFAEMPPGVSSGKIAFARLCWFILMPIAYVAALYLPGVTRYVRCSTVARQTNRKTEEEVQMDTYPTRRAPVARAPDSYPGDREAEP